MTNPYQSTEAQIKTTIENRIADELKVARQQISATVGLLDEGASVPFIARYRKEVTGGLDDSQLRLLEERLLYLRELEDRRGVILKSIDEQGKLNPELAGSIQAAATKVELEDIYLPYKPKRRTKGQIAIEAGLEPLADALLANPALVPEDEAKNYLNSEHKIESTKDALDGAKFILMERFSEAAELLAKLRLFLGREAVVTSKVMTGKEEEGKKFNDYFDYEEPLGKVVSHRALALFRGRNEGVLSVNLGMADLEPGSAHPCEAMVAEYWSITEGARPADAWLREVVRWTWRVKLLPKLETDLFAQLREGAETEAINVFANNLKDLLLAAPAGQKATIGLDPGLRTGVKLAAVDATGKVVEHGAIFPTAPQKRIQEAEATLVHVCKKHNIQLIAIGNGTASRETEQFVKDTLKRHPDIKAMPVVVNEAGASVYSASELAAKEFPDLDVTIRGAVSIARRLQDPLAELVKIEPKSIGVGQYQHDVSQTQLGRSLGATVEDCVNTVGVEVNTASAPLLARVSGLNQTIANNIVQFREQHGAFASRKQLKEVPRLGEKTWEQAVGFLRISGGDNPLDASAVHPESYGIVETIASRSERSVEQLIADKSALRQFKPGDFVSDSVGLPTLVDIFSELEKPGRDPRPEFKTATFKEGVEKITDLKEGMILEGSVTNVANFGAFVDVGVHQDGLVHISALANHFVKDPRTVVKTGDVVKVKVMELDVSRKRISLSMRLDDEPGQSGDKQRNGTSARSGQGRPGHKQRNQTQAPAASQGTMGDLLKAAMKKK